ncbi:MAG: flagellin [Campylobacterota bacterium]|nr:flagellin [Campylobacterota bacterium]
MQLNRLEMIEQSQVEYVSKVSKIQESEEKTKVDPDEQYKNAQPKAINKENDIILDNVKFGYNEDSKEFFVRVTRGDNEYQFPTEDMFRLKQSLSEAYQNTKQS